MAIARIAASLFADVRYALRRLRNAPGYALTSILMLGLGLGATAAMLAVVDSVLLRPVALPHPEQLMLAYLARASGNGPDVSFRQIEALKRGAPGLANVSGYNMFPKAVSTGSGTRITTTVDATTDFMDTAGVRAHLGRTFTAADLGAPVAVVSDTFWRDNLHGDPQVIGSTIRTEGRVITIVGVMLAGFAFPPQSSDEPTVCLPIRLNEKGEDQNGFDSANVMARLRPGVTRAVAQAQAQAVFSRDTTAANHGARLMLHSYGDSVVEREQAGLLALLGACALLLAIACMNSANLQIARGTAREGEMRLRAALGASRKRLLQQIVTESITLSLLGAGFGIPVAEAAVRWARHAYGTQFARFDELALHPLVFICCALLAIAVGVLAALAPALSAVRGAAGSLNAQTSRGSHRSRLSGVLVMAEVALTCVLLATAGLFLRTFQALQHVPLGLDPHHVTEIVLMPINPAEDPAALKQTYTNLLARLDAMPGITAAATQTSMPFSRFSLGINGGFRVLGIKPIPGQQTELSLVNTGLNRTLGISLLQGRALRASDVEGAPYVCLVNESFVRKFLHGARALGRSVEFTRDATDTDDYRPIKVPMTIVGVMPDVTRGTYNSFNSASPTMYLDYRQLPVSAASARFFFGLAPQFAVRSSLPQGALDREIRTALKQTAPDMAEMSLGSMDEAMSGALDNQRLALRLASGFGFIALVLSAIGIYGVLAYTVAQRTREIGIRMALGSTRAGAVRLVTRQAGAMAGFGLIAGLLAAWPAGRAVRSFLFGVKPLDPFSLAATAALLLLVCAAAAAAPAWRAAQVDPAEALRAE